MFTLLALSITARAADYTGDGIDDLVVGVPYESIGTVTETGAIEVIRGSTSGLTSSGDAFIHQDTTGVPSANMDNEYFGWAIAAGDIDADGVTDLIVSAPFEVVPSSGADGGAIWRLELTSTMTGMSVDNAQVIGQNTAGVSDSTESGDEFGSAVVVADFNGDGYDDVVVGIHDEDVGTIVDAGAVEYLPGSAAGLTATGQIYYDQDGTGVAGTAETGDHFGDALAAGDFDGDGYADLAIGISGEDWSGKNEGSVQVMYGGSTGPQVTSPNDELWSAGSARSVAGTMQDYNYCGGALTVGDFDGDGYDDLAIGCWGYTVGTPYYEFGEGAVLVVYGSSSGLDVSELWTQDSPGIAGVAMRDDNFGTSLTSGDYDGDGYDDLAVGTREELSYYEPYVGSVHVIPGSSSGLTSTGSVFLRQDVGGVVAGTPDDADFFGWAVTSGDWNDDGLDDLAVGAMGDDDGGAPGAGVVNVFYGSTTGPSTTGDRLFSQNTPGIEDAAEDYDYFGASLR